MQALNKHSYGASVYRYSSCNHDRIFDIALKKKKKKESHVPSMCLVIFFFLHYQVCVSTTPRRTSMNLLDSPVSYTGRWKREIVKLILLCFKKEKKEETESSRAARWATRLWLIGGWCWCCECGSNVSHLEWISLKRAPFNLIVRDVKQNLTF